MAEAPDVLVRSLGKRLDFLVGLATALRGTFELLETETGYQAVQGDLRGLIYDAARLDDPLIRYQLKEKLAEYRLLEADRP